MNLLPSITAAVVAALAILPVHHAPAQSSDRTIVAVEGGKVRGKAGDGLLVFKGVPFAAPPVGKLRWRAPQPVQAWEGVRDAFEAGPDPIQPAMGGMGSKLSEDCLYLNVWRPQNSGDAPLPVMVWIYGGGLVNGGGSNYPGEGLASQGIVVVVFNYRVGRLGFFAHPALAAEAPGDLRGNYGFMDQLAALQWVQKNIAAFGGDPAKVTIAGESAGGGSVLTHLTSPLSRGLFRGAILQSPGIPGPRAAVGPLRPLETAESIAIEYAKSLGITGDDEAVLKGLRALPAGKFTENTDNYVRAIFGGPELPGLSHSMVDGRIHVESPENALRGGRQAMVPVLAGANDYDLAYGPAVTKDALFTKFGVLAPQARQLYDPKGDADFKQIYQNLDCDRGMIEPTRHLCDVMTKAGQPAYFYRFSYVPESLRATLPGVPHAVEVPFIFNRPAFLLKDKVTAADSKMAADASGYWADFVKTGNPNGGGRPEWKPYDPAKREVLNFTNTAITYGPDPIRERLDLLRKFWEQNR